MDHVQKILEILREHKLYAKKSKGTFLGFIFSKDKIIVDLAKVKEVVDWPPPRTIKEI